MLDGAAVGLHPVMLPSVGNHGHDLTISRALAGPPTLHEGWGNEGGDRA